MSKQKVSYNIFDFENNIDELINLSNPSSIQQEIINLKFKQIWKKNFEKSPYKNITNELFYLIDNIKNEVIQNDITNNQEEYFLNEDLSFIYKLEKVYNSKYKEVIENYNLKDLIKDYLLKNFENDILKNNEYILKKEINRIFTQFNK